MDEDIREIYFGRLNAQIYMILLINHSITVVKNLSSSIILNLGALCLPISLFLSKLSQYLCSSCQRLHTNLHSTVTFIV